MIHHTKVKPKVRGRSDFFSWQLFRWLKKYPTRTTIWSATWNVCNGIDPKNQSLFIGDQRDGSWIHARQLRNLCTSGSKLEAHAYGSSHDTQNWTDISKAFWEDYLRVGVCAIHGDYAHKFDVEGGTRTCEYCDKSERLTQKTIVTDVWVPV